MSSEKDMNNALLAIHSKLETIEGKVDLSARANRPALRAELEKAIKADPLLGQIYLLLDGERNQIEIKDKLSEFGIKTSQPTVSRRMEALAREHGVAVLVRGGNQLVLRKETESVNSLNLPKLTRDWLKDIEETIPVKPKRRPRKTKM